jgi:hypothetical protein
VAELSKGEIAWLREQFNSIKNFALELEEDIFNTSGRFGIEDVFYVCGEYSTAREYFETLKGNMPFSLKEISLKANMANLPTNAIMNPQIVRIHTRRTLRTIAYESKKAIAYLEEIKSPLISNESISELKSLREEIKKISSKLNPDIEKNYIFAIDSFEDGHLLGASLIASRVIEYYLDKLKGNDIEEQIQSIRSKIKFDKKRQDVRDLEQNLIKSSKFARNLLSHNIQAIPEPEESLSLLSNCISLIKIMVE